MPVRHGFVAGCARSQLALSRQCRAGAVDVGKEQAGFFAAVSPDQLRSALRQDRRDSRRGSDTDGVARHARSRHCPAVCR